MAETGNGRLLLTPQHLADLRASGLSDDTIHAAGLYSVTDADTVKQLLGWKWSAAKLGSCLVFPFAQDGGYTRVKPDRPRMSHGRVAKYEAPAGQPNRAYFPPGVAATLADPGASVIICEGEKKSLCGAQHGFACVGLVGVWSWCKRRSRNAAGRGVGRFQLIADLDAVSWSGRTVCIAFDSDAADKPDVQWAEHHLAETLAARGAEVLIVRLPPGPDGAKTGLDDFLVAHSADDLKALLAAARPAEKPARQQDDRPSNVFANFAVTMMGDKAQKVGLSGPKLADQARKLTGGWPKRVGSLLFVADGDQPAYLEESPALFAWLGRQLPQDGFEKNPLQWAEGEDKLPRSEFFATLQQTGDAYDAVEQYPHVPRLPRHYYLHPRLAGGDGSALASLLHRFHPATDFDADLIKAFFLTLVAGVPPGGRPAFLFTAAAGDDNAGRGIGKTSVAEMGAQLVGGHISVTPADPMTEVKKRLLSPDSRGLRVLLLDNVKSLKFSWDELEALITTSVISGRQLYVGEGRIPNRFVVTITLNGASLSKDMANRCVIVELVRPPTYCGKWTEETRAYIEESRWAIFGDLIAELRRPVPPLARHSRWGSWEDLVIARLPRPAETQQIIEQRQGEVDDDREEADLVRDAFINELLNRDHNPHTETILIPSATVAYIVNEALGEKRPINKASAYLKTLGIKELRKSDRSDARGWMWCGSQSKSAKAVPLNSRTSSSFG
jgi:hypothetical protein